MQDDLERQLLNLLEEPRAMTVERERSAFDQLAGPRGQSLVLFGAGGLGRKTLAGLRSIGIQPLAFVDNNPALWGRFIDGLKVLQPAEAMRDFGNAAVFVVTLWNYSVGHPVSEIRRQLGEFGPAQAISFGPLFWKYPETFLPHYTVDQPHKVQAQAAQVKYVFDLLADETSRQEYLAQIHWRLFLDDGQFAPIAPGQQYFPHDFLRLRPDEQFVDCGAFDGDTLREFLRRRGDAFRKAYAFEPDVTNFTKLTSYVNSLPGRLSNRIELFQAATGAKRGKLRFETTGGVQSAVTGSGNAEVECVALDDVLEPSASTYIKMDIEGGEPDALRGAADTIRKSRPALAICVYHHFEHLWTLPAFVASLSEGYRFFLRRYAACGWETVCYAVPVDRLPSDSQQPRAS
jgi:FkbM family methyltransferase